MISLAGNHLNQRISLYIFSEGSFKSIDSKKEEIKNIETVLFKVVGKIYNFDENILLEKIPAHLSLQSSSLSVFPIFWPDNEIYGTLFIDLEEIPESDEKVLFEIQDMINSDIRGVLSLKRKEKIIQDMRYYKAKSRALISSIPIGIVSVNKDGSINMANSTALKTFNYSAIEVVKKNIWDLIGNIENIGGGRKLYNTPGLHTLGPRDNIFGIRKDGTEFPIKLEISYGVNYTQVEAILTVEDLSTCKIFQRELHERDKEAERRIEEQTGYLIDVERQAAFGQLVQGIVHNIKNPLSVIALNAEYLKKHSKKSKTIKRNNSIINAAERINKIVSSLLIKSREDKESEIKPVDINVLVEQEVEFLHADPVFKHEVQKVFELTKNPLCVKVIPAELAQVIQNLIRNSIDAMYDQNEKRISITSIREGQAALLIIEDNGPGIDKKNHEKVFDPFFTTKPKMRKDKENISSPIGTGLGLWMCRSMIESYSGTITLSSEKGEGTSFSIALPICDEVVNQET